MKSKELPKEAGFIISERKTDKLTPLKAIRVKCLECAGSPKEVRNCPIYNCPLYPYRMGHNPKRQGVGRFKKQNLAHTQI